MSGGASAAKAEAIVATSNPANLDARIFAFRIALKLRRAEEEFIP